MMVALDPPTVHYVPLAEATRRMKKVPLDCDAMLTACEIGVNFGVTRAPKAVGTTSAFEPTTPRSPQIDHRRRTI